MAQIPDSTLTTIFTLKRRLVELINDVKATEFNLFENFGETEGTLSELAQLQNATERLRIPYERLHNLTLLISESQPFASVAMLDLLAQTVEVASLTADAVEATTQETKRIWNLP